MADVEVPALQSVHPLARWEAAFAELPVGLHLAAEPLEAAAGLRVPPGPGHDAVATLLGAALPTAGHWAANVGTSPQRPGRLVWFGPDEWLVTSPDSTPQQLEDALGQAVGPHGGSAVDVSANRVGIRVAGVYARELLSGGCPVDLHPRVFGPGSAILTTLANSAVVLVANPRDGVDGADLTVLVRSSFARHLADWLIDAALEFAPVRP